MADQHQSLAGVFTIHAGPKLTDRSPTPPPTARPGIPARLWHIGEPWHPISVPGW